MPTCTFMTKNGKVSFNTKPKHCNAKHGKKSAPKQMPKPEPQETSSGRRRRVPSRLMY